MALRWFGGVVVSAVALTGFAPGALAQGHQPERRGVSALDMPEVAFAPRIDGTIDPDEWDGAAVTELENGDELLSCQSRGVFYLAVRPIEPGQPGVLTVAMASGDHLHLLHASAQSGRAILERWVASEPWHLREDFQWIQPGRGEAAELLQEGWAANRSGFSREGCVEMAIRLEYWDDIREERDADDAPRDGEPATFAIGYYNPNTDTPWWTVPTIADDALASERVLQGWLSCGQVYRPDDWFTWPGE